ncbi:MAG: PilZ domain-containing protein [Allosphingosinicella sp.]
MHEIRSTLIRGESRGPLASKKTGGAKAADGSLTAIRVRREETRRSDQRREARHLNVVDRADLRHRRKSHDVAVLNVSSRGAMIESDLPLQIGARIELGFAECNPTECFVRWLRDGRVGLEFGNETLVIGANDERERFVSGRREGEHVDIKVKSGRAPRHGLILMAELHTRHGSMTVKLRNISAEGVMLEAPKDLEPWSDVVLEIPGAAIPGRVRWCRSKQVGISFDNVFDLELLNSRTTEEPATATTPADYVKPDYLRTEMDPNSPWAARRERLSTEDL